MKFPVLEQKVASCREPFSFAQILERYPTSRRTIGTRARYWEKKNHSCSRPFSYYGHCMCCCYDLKCDFSLQMKQLILVFVVLMVVCEDVQGGSCYTACKTKEQECVHTPTMCKSPMLCNQLCVQPFVRCFNGCRRKRELLSNFFQVDYDKED